MSKNDDAAVDTFIDFDLASVRCDKRPKAWVDTLNEFFYDYDSQLPDDFTSGSIKGRHIGALSVARIAADAMSVWRTRSHITRDAIDGYFVLLPNDRPIALGQRNKEAIVGGGQFALVSTSDTYTFMQSRAGSYDNIIIPGPLMRRLAPRVDDDVALTLGDRSIDRLFCNFSSSFCRDVSGIHDRATHRISQQVVELLGLVLDGADRTSNATPIQDAHYRHIRRFVELNYTNPACDIHLVSTRMRLSVRYIQTIFAAKEETVSGVIRRLRVRDAKHLIQNRQINRLTITEIAFKVGFGDLAHFSRVYKKETGHAPTCTPA